MGNNWGNRHLIPIYSWKLNDKFPVDGHEYAQNIAIYYAFGERTRVWKSEHAKLIKVIPLQQLSHLSNEHFLVISNLIEQSKLINLIAFYLAIYRMRVNVRAAIKRSQPHNSYLLCDIKCIYYVHFLLYSKYNYTKMLPYRNKTRTRTLTYRCVCCVSWWKIFL